MVRINLSLSDVSQFLDGAQYAVVGGKRVVQKADKSLPVEAVVHAIYAGRPNLFCSKLSRVEPYLNAAQKFQKLLPKEGNKTLLQEIVDCFWSSYCPMQVYWCTSWARECVVIADAKLGLDGLREWKRSTSESAHM